jgi:formamidopyrimidine-DNA glycosylase
MPELPEVETIRRGLQRWVIGKKIAKVEVRQPKLVRNPLPEFNRYLTGNEIIAVDRKGKLLFLELKNHNVWLIIHLKMTGQLVFVSAREKIAGGHEFPPTSEQLPNKYSHIIFTFQDNSHLFFNDLRRFGYLKVVSRDEKEATLASLGIDPLGPEYNLDKFRSIFKNKKKALKALLLDQTILAGLGNIYADEVCFAAGIHPDRLADKLTSQDLEKLYRSIRAIMHQAVKAGGTTFRNYRNAEGQKGNFVKQLAVYQRSKLVCRRCQKGIIVKTRLIGRGTHFCPICQK